MKKLTLAIVLLSANIHAADYQTAPKLEAGDVISADVLNDLFEKIEFNLKPADELDFLGTWNITQTINWYAPAFSCVLGGSHGDEHEDEHEDEHGDEHDEDEQDYCNISAASAGFGESIDNLYRQRSDQVTFFDDGDGTFSLKTKERCAFTFFGWGVEPCEQRFAIVDDIFVSYDVSMGGDNDTEVFFNVRKISESRINLSLLLPSQTQYSVIRLEKLALTPAAPSDLSATFDGGTVSLSWTENDSNFTSYSVRTKDKAKDVFTELSTSISNSYVDQIDAGTSRWYRVFATNSAGDSIGSNVIRITY